MARIKGQAFSAGGRPLVTGSDADHDRDWGWIQELDRACTAWLRKRGILYREERP